MLLPPLQLWQVLKEEFESFHGPEGVEFYLKKPRRWAEELRALLSSDLSDDPLAAYLIGKIPDGLRRHLEAWNKNDHLPVGLRNGLFNFFHILLGDTGLPEAAGAARLKEAFKDASLATTQAGLLVEDLTRGELARVNLALLEALRPDDVGRPNVVGQFASKQPSEDEEMEEDSEERLRGMYYYIRAEDHAALCLSGGGIRSATFNLGILQGLARHGLLQQFHYLSTVSGGGFIGGWLSAWIARDPDGINGVVKALAEPPREPLEPDPPPLTHLRAYGNYLSPKVGLLSADTWTMVATVARNVFLNWLVFVPLLAAFLMLPRLWAAFLLRQSLPEVVVPGVGPVPWGVLIGFVFATLALLNIGLNLPSLGTMKDSQFRFLLTVLLPLLVAAMSLASWWSHANLNPKADGGGKSFLAGWGWTWEIFVLFSLALIVVPWVVFFYNFTHKYFWERRRARETSDEPPPSALVYLFKFVFASGAIALAQVITGLLTWYVATKLLVPQKGQEILYATISVPALLLLLGLSATLIAGFTSRFTEDSEQEWWARCGAWVLITSGTWLVFCAIVLFGPMIFDFLNRNSTQSSYEAAAKALATVGGVVSGVITLLGGFSSRTPANAEEAKRAGPVGNGLRLLTGLLAPVSLAFIYILIAFGTNVIITRNVAAALDHGAVINRAAEMPNSEPLLLLAVLVVFLFTALLMGYLISTNRFSLHFFWRNRIVRAYLGASRGTRHPHPFTGFDHDDNLHMYQLRDHHPACVHHRGDGAGAGAQAAGEGDARKRKRRPNRLLHVINIALNLSGSARLAWQQRKAESFTVSPLHAGSYLLGYRRACEYTDGGITLGSAVAISGAFASPNMGYMMTSPVVRFIMTLFNVRFGWWLGNPGDLSKTSFLNRLLLKLIVTPPHTHDSPALSVIPIVQEAFGQIDDRSPYVYLSDGGHFENFGLYEMVLRRCRFIVVSDASTDPKYAFGSLGQSIRQIRVDLGVPIELSEFSITGPGLKETGTYCAVGRIRYSCVDGNPTGEAGAVDGTLIYIKPALTGTEPRDVINYQVENEGFPQEFIGDQWFTESQFESYRALGSHIVDEICGSQPDPIPAFDFKKFMGEVIEYNKRKKAEAKKQRREAAVAGAAAGAAAAAAAADADGTGPVSEETRAIMPSDEPQTEQRQQPRNKRPSNRRTPT